jgi:hypothetical protein
MRLDLLFGNLSLGELAALPDTLHSIRWIQENMNAISIGAAAICLASGLLPLMPNMLSNCSTQFQGWNTGDQNPLNQAGRTKLQGNQ